MRKGGYLIIDLKDNTLSSKVTIEGVYDAVKDNYRKVILLSGIKLGGALLNDAFVTATKSGTDYVIDIYDYTITISVDDGVVAVANE